MKTTQGTKALFYKPTDRWQIWISLAATILLYMAAVALAGADPDAAPVVTGDEQVVQIDVVNESSEPPPPPIPEDIPDVPLPQDIQSDVPEENPTPAPARTQVKASRVVRLVRPALVGVGGSATLSAARVFALSAPRPEYPYEARRQRLTGSGVALLAVDPASGAVTNVTISRSTGSPVLDNAAISGFRRWRFRAGTVSKVQAPITFTLTGAAY